MTALRHKPDSAIASHGGILLQTLTVCGFRWTTQHLQLPEPRSAMVGQLVGDQIIRTNGDNAFLPKQSTWGLNVPMLNG
jgi:hypothetical protein